MFSTPTRPPDGAWSRPLLNEHCNYHRDEPALISYAGTPLCDRCAKRMGWLVSEDDPRSSAA